MADPKYANLPGIDLNSPDVYETNELPEDDQNQRLLEEEEANEAIETEGISADAAFKAFKGKPGVDASNIDFSDSVRKGRNTGYDVHRTEYEILGSGSGIKETPQQKYNRLQHEFRQLVDDIQEAKDEATKQGGDGGGASAVAMAKQVEYLQQQLTDLQLDKCSSSDVNLSDPSGALQTRLITELETFKGTKSGASKGAKEGSSDQLTYELFYRPDQAKFGNMARFADLEQRIEALEVLLGNQPDKMAALTAETSNKSLIGAVALLTSKTHLLEPSQLDQVEGRLVALNQRLTHISDKKDQAEQSDKLGKVTELYEMVQKWNSVADTLPHIVQRLTALKQLHEQALQFSQTLSHLDSAQEKVNALLESHGDMVGEVKSTLNENMSVIRNNCESLETRVKNLKAK